MAPIDNLTPNRGYPLPAGANNLKDDVLRLILAIGAIDGDVAAALTSLASVAPKVSPVFTGTPEAPTPLSGDDSNRLATTAFVKAAFDLLIGAAPGALDTLNELAAALGNDPDFATTVTNALAGKADGAATTAALATKANADATTAALAEKLAKAGDTMTGTLAFNKTLSTNNLLLDLMQGFGLFSDNTGTGSANKRLWVNTPDGADLMLGPRAGAEKLAKLSLRAASLVRNAGGGDLRLLDTGDLATLLQQMGASGNNAQNGYFKLPPPFPAIVQWGRVTVPTGGATVNFPITFPNTFAAIAAMADANADVTYSADNRSTSACSIRGFVGGVSGGSIATWIAVGY